MSYAINPTNTGWRAINSVSDLLEGESFSSVQPVLSITPSIQSQIDALDGGDPMARPTREFLLLSMEEKAVAAGYTVAQLRASHYGYRKVKELDEQIAALRAQL
jgi:hypothetical protein